PAITLSRRKSSCISVWLPPGGGRSRRRGRLSDVTDEHTTLLLGGRIYTPAGPDATAMAVTGGTVVWIGQDAPARALHPGAELDAAAGSTPVYLSRVDVHSALVSTALVELAPAARDTDGWSPDGPLTRAAHHAVRAAVRAAITPEQRDRAQRAFLAEAARQ